MVENVGIFGVFLVVLPFPNSILLKYSTYQSPLFKSFHVILPLFKVRVNIYFDALPVYNHADWWKMKRGAHHVLFHWTLNLSEHGLGQNVSGMTNHNFSAQGPAQY